MMQKFQDKYPTLPGKMPREVLSRSKAIRIGFHVMGWLIMFGYPFLWAATFQNNHADFIRSKPFIAAHLIMTFMKMGLFYLNYLVLVPKYFDRKRYKEYTVFLLAFIMVMYFVDKAVFYFVSQRDEPHRLLGFLIYNGPQILFILLASTALHTLILQAQTARRLQAKENEHLKTELLFLRNQVNPHFMFNVLNGMVALARKKSDLLETSLIKLSSLLRYMLYETDETKVALEKEADYLNSYIDLQKQRFGNTVLVSVNMQPIDPGFSIEPMLLIPFVENAFKHGTGIVEDPFIDVDMSEEKGMLHFTVANKFAHDVVEIKDNSSGIGLVNVKRRLNLLYGNKHTLSISDADNVYKIDLKIDLNS